jgi:hypothetical protein
MASNSLDGATLMEDKMEKWHLPQLSLPLSLIQTLLLLPSLLFHLLPVTNQLVIIARGLATLLTNVLPNSLIYWMNIGEKSVIKGMVIERRDQILIILGYNLLLSPLYL